jgi:hypothetical protein
MWWRCAAPGDEGPQADCALGPRDRERDDITVVDATPTDLAEIRRGARRRRPELIKTVVELRDTIVREVMTPGRHRRDSQ